MSRLGYITMELQKAAEEDRDVSLSDADIRWAMEWDRYDLLEAAGYNVAELQESAGVDSTPEQTDPYNTAGVPRGGANDRTMELDPETGRQRSVQESGSPGSGDGDDDEEDDLPDDYNAWKVDQLRAELKARQLPADGNKPDLVSRLEADDEAAENG